MTVDQIREFLKRFRAKHSVEVTQTAEAIAQMLGYWHPPADLIVDDQNLFDLFDHCLFHHRIEPMWLDTTCRESREYLRWHTSPQPAPLIPEPAAPEPKLTGSDSLGSGAVSVEKPISSVQDAPTESTALQDGVAYAWGKETKQTRIDRAWQECRNASFETINGQSVLNHAKARTLFEPKRQEIEKEYAPKNEMTQKEIDRIADVNVERYRREYDLKRRQSREH